jgi:hypothetical protein
MPSSLRFSMFFLTTIFLNGHIYEILLKVGIFLAIPRKINIASSLPLIGWGSDIIFSISFSHGIP